MNLIYKLNGNVIHVTSYNSGQTVADSYTFTPRHSRLTFLRLLITLPKTSR